MLEHSYFGVNTPSIFGPLRNCAPKPEPHISVDGQFPRRATLAPSAQRQFAGAVTIFANRYLAPAFRCLEKSRTDRNDIRFRVERYTVTMAGALVICRHPKPMQVIVCPFHYGVFIP